MFSYLHYAMFKNRNHGGQLTCINSLIRQLDISSKSQYGTLFSCFPNAFFEIKLFSNTSRTKLVLDSILIGFFLSKTALLGAYDEVFAIQKTSMNPDTALPTHRHAGYIVSCFKILDQSFKVGS